MTELESRHTEGMSARPDQPLIGLVVRQGGRDVVRYFADEAAADAAVTDEAVRDALGLAGAWSDLDWDDMEAEIDRIRHANSPTPPISLDV